MNKRQRRLLAVYLVVLAVVMLWVNYERGVGKGDSPGQAAAVSALVFTLVVGVGGALLWRQKHKGGEIRWDDLGKGHPGEDRKPPGWIWDDTSKRWRKPPPER